jgi:hypothetical protein
MNYAVGMTLGAMINVPNFIRIGSGIAKFIAGDTHAYRQTGTRPHKPFYNKESNLKIWS